MPLSQEETLRAIAALDRSIVELKAARACLAGDEVDVVATSLHGPARQPDENYISAGAAARLFGLCDDTIRRHARKHKIATVGTGRYVRYSTRELRDFYRQK